MARAKDDKPSVLEAGDLGRRLRAMYGTNDSAVCFEVRNSAGHEANRSCDAIAIGLWPSRGCRITGFEIKVSRGDWLRELKAPAKAEAFFPYTDAWFVVAASTDIVKLDELPPAWGLMVPRGDGLTTIRAAENRESTPMPRGMLAAFVKRASMQSAVKHELEAKYSKGFEDGKRAVESSRKYAQDRDAELRKKVDRFQEQTGISVEFGYDHDKLRTAYELVRRGAHAGVVNRMRAAQRELERFAVGLGESASKIEQALSAEPTELQLPAADLIPPSAEFSQ